jgi:hypothetical protein
MARVAPGIWDEKRLAILVPAGESSGQAVAMIWALLRQKLAAREYATRREWGRTDSEQTGVCVNVGK